MMNFTTYPLMENITTFIEAENTTFQFMDNITRVPIPENTTPVDVTDNTTIMSEVETMLTTSRFLLPHIYVERLNQKTALQLIVPTVYVAIMMAIGVFGNVLVLYIYGLRWHRATTKIFVTTLAILDLVNCVITMPTELMVLNNFYYLDAPGFCRLSRFSTFWMNNNSAVVLLIISVDRFIKICMPNKRSFSYRGSKIACLLAVFVGFGVSWPGFVIYGNHTVFFRTPHGWMKFIMCNVDDAMKDTWYPFGYYIYLWVAFLGIALIMIILYSLIGIQIWIRKLKRDKRSDSLKASSFKFSTSEGKKIYKGSVEKKVHVSLKSTSDESSGTELSEDVFKNDIIEKIEMAEARKMRKHRLPTLASIKVSKHGMQAGKATMMLAIITMVYVISFLPFLVITMIRTLKGDLWYGSLSQAEKVAVNVFLRSYLVSNTVNPIIYGFCNVQFRQETARLFRKMTCRKKKVEHGGSYSSTVGETGASVFTIL